MIDLAVWPVDFDARDPWDDDPVLFDAAWRIHRRRAPMGGLDKKDFRQTLRDFEEATRAWLGGDQPFESLRPIADKLLLDAEQEPDVRDVEHPAAPADASELARIGPNGHPDLASEAPGRLFGPWEDLLTRPKHDHLLRAALAEAAFIERTRGELSGWMRFRRRRPMPSIEERARVRAVAHAPVSVWTLTSRVEGGWRMADRVGLVARRVPIGPVALWDPVSVTGTEPAHGVTLVGRVVATETGWVAPMPFLVPGEPPKSLIERNVQLMLWRQRLVLPRVSREETLSNAGYTLIRRVHEWAWSKEKAPETH